MEARSLNTIMLVDDDDVYQFLCKKLIKKANLGEKKVISCSSGEEALEYIINAESANKPLPDLILLDINMPRMDGWDFLNEFEKLDDELKRSVVITMLSTSVFSNDKARAESYKSVAGYVTKPITIEDLQGLKNKYFNEVENVNSH